GLQVDALQQKWTENGEVMVARVHVKGVELEKVLAGMVEEALKGLPIPKVMRWGDGDAQFVRPVHGLVMLHGKKVVPGSVLGLQSENRTQGHRFMGKGAITLATADGYEKGLLENHV